MDPLSLGASTIDAPHPSIIRFEWAGPLSPAHVDALRDYTRVMRERTSVDGPIYALIDVGRASGIGKDARGSVRDFGREHPWARTAVVGASFQLRVLLELTAKGIQLVTNHEVETRFCDSQREALDWLRACDPEID